MNRSNEAFPRQDPGAEPAEPLHHVRVIGVYAHIDAGKTTTSEAILYLTGRIHRAGSVDDGNTQLDWMEQERERGITITAAATTCTWHGCQIHLIDTPGHIDFTAEVMRSIRVIDSAVVVMCAVGGVETQTETVWRQAEQQHLPRLIFINKLDRETADFEQALASARKRLTPHVVALHLPVGCGDTFRGVVDLLEQKALLWLPGEDEPREAAIPAELVERARDLRSELVDAICETDETLLTQRLEEIEPDLPELRAALRRATIAGLLTPVLCGSARKRCGIQPLLDAIVTYLPSPLDLPPVSGSLPESDEPITRAADPAAPFCASAFKIVADAHVGHLVWVRVFSGTRAVGEVIYNPRSGEEERIGRIYRIHANRREHVTSMSVGDVVALVGVKSVITGDTLCLHGAPVLLEPFRFPDPVISVALAVNIDEERDKLHLYASHLCEEDPTLKLSYDAETGEQVLSGMGELHLEIAIDRLRSEYGMTVRSSQLQVAYRETVLRKAEATGNYRKQSGGHGHFAMLRLRVQPLKRGEGILFRSIANPVDVPDNYVRAGEAGVREALEKGILAGYPVTDVRITLLSGKFHEIDSDAMDFRIAGSMAIRQALRQAVPALLEPVMAAGISVGEEYLGAVLGDFSRRRGIVQELEIHHIQRSIRGEVPLAEVRGYATSLRDMSQGRGSFTLEFRRYDMVPERQAESIIEQRLAAGKISRR
jgi:elongation factor G